MSEREQRCGAMIAALFDELDWPLLGAAYCEGDARDFFDAERREQVLDVGLQLADDLASVLPTGGPRRSLYLGAAVAETVPILVEHLVLEREVHWFNLPGPELIELTRALRAVGRAFDTRLPLPDPHPLADCAPQPCDHLWMTSVLTDPDAFPALHDELYERAGTLEATGRGDLTSERVRAGELLDVLLSWAAPSCVLTTSADELAFVLPHFAARALEHETIPLDVVSALVGDPLVACRVGQRADRTR